MRPTDMVMTSYLLFDLKKVNGYTFILLSFQISFPETSKELFVKTSKELFVNCNVFNSKLVYQSYSA